MLNKASILDEFLIKTILADIFDLLISKDIDFVLVRIIDGLQACRMLKKNMFNKLG